MRPASCLRAAGRFVAGPATRSAAWLAAVAIGFAAPARADVYVVVNSANPATSLSQKEAIGLFMGRSRAFSNGDYALVFDLPRDAPLRATFYQALTGMSLAQVNSYWSRLIFAGQTVPPQALPDEAAMVNVVRRNPGAVGYLVSEPADRSLHTVLVLKDSK